MRGATKRVGTLVVLAVAAVAGTGCAGMSGTHAGALLGALAGGGAGLAIGHHNGRDALGGLAGAGLGALVGGLMGAVDDAESERHAVPAVDVLGDADQDLPPVPRRRVARTVTRTRTVYRTVSCPTTTTEVIIIDE